MFFYIYVQTLSLCIPLPAHMCSSLFGYVLFSVHPPVYLRLESIPSYIVSLP